MTDEKMSKTDIARQLREVKRALKRKLKHLSKGEIIAVCIDQALRENEMRNIAQQLYKENKELKNTLDPVTETSTEETPDV